MTMKWTATAMRLVLAAIFLGHGISKINSGMDLMADWFSSVGLPGFLAYMVAMLELVCGTLMGLGVLTRSAAIGFIVVMIGAIVTVKLPAGLLGNAGSPGYELDLALMALAAYFVASKETGFGIDSLFAERDRREEERFNAAAAVEERANADAEASSLLPVAPTTIESSGFEPNAADAKLPTNRMLRASARTAATAANDDSDPARLVSAAADNRSARSAPSLAEPSKRKPIPA
ncbi:hypothetical protein CDO73_04805 [Saccharibacillus sp. O23]|uniref:DoxX family protein n=1 Tax=Saccharibacillus sp. O23 TaxID=2009338 RepID=UPI000B4E4B22|nr:DoxX family protein [Saccharibacillus sp. O23]OWR31803.1 hypothetical protein CDO73_04805 [Saccharibacillus sp. O23]